MMRLRRHCNLNTDCFVTDCILIATCYLYCDLGVGGVLLIGLLIGLMDFNNLFLLWWLFVSVGCTKDFFVHEAAQPSDCLHVIVNAYPMMY